ncbi:MAG: hypothetical protein Q4A32_02695 [Lachnospiraceae bacterium]|nr:hypothetical protein [Lachnospiraceae bacterium]
MNRIGKKLRSQDGASITFALLLFMVCAILCSALLVAATTASGRMAQMAERDQRYYAVASASEMLEGLISGEDNVVTIIKVTEEKQAATYTNGVVTDTTNADPVKTEYLVDKSPENLDKTADLTDENKMHVASTKSIVADAAMNMDSATPLTGRTLAITSRVNTALGITEDPLAVTVSEDLQKISDETDEDDPEGAGGAAWEMKLTVHNSDGEPFTQILTFTTEGVKGSLPPEVTTTTSDPDMDGEDVSYTVTTTKKTYETVTYSWTLSGIGTKTGDETESGG